jgi:hypothetical protein
MIEVRLATCIRRESALRLTGTHIHIIHPSTLSERGQHGIFSLGGFEGGHGVHITSTSGNDQTKEAVAEQARLSTIALAGVVIMIRRRLEKAPGIITESSPVMTLGEVFVQSLRCCGLQTDIVLTYCLRSLPMTECIVYLSRTVGFHLKLRGPGEDMT